MGFRILTTLSGITIFTVFFSSCLIMHQSSKYAFNDGIYQTKRFSKNEVYVLKIDDDTIAVFPVLEFKDSTAILIKKRQNYYTLEKKLKDNISTRTFYKPSFDADVMTIPLKYRPPAGDLPNQLTTNFNGALFAGYRIDAYRLNYKRTPLNRYKQNVKHMGYSAGLYLGIGNTSIDQWSLNNPNTTLQYEGMILITGIAANMAIENLTIGISIGTDHLLDQYHTEWIYEGKPCAGFTIGLNLK